MTLAKAVERMFGSAETGALMLEDCYQGRLERHWKVDDRIDQDGVQAYLVHGVDQRWWLVVPGTGYAESGKPSEFWPDWLRNAASVFGMAWSFGGAMPVTGQSGVFRWGRGFLQEANIIDTWLAGRRVDVAIGHSQGGAAVQILAWSRWWRWHGAVGAAVEPVHEAHAFASARPCFSPSLPVPPRLHVWAAVDDLVPKLPIGAFHAGITHKLPSLGIGSLRERHAILGYRARLADEHARLLRESEP
mgnify:CR=1 FL=1